VGVRALLAIGHRTGPLVLDELRGLGAGDAAVGVERNTATLPEL